jgi:hypothetical protein
MRAKNKLLALTNSANQSVKKIYKTFQIKEYSNSSHWILLEEGRKYLAKDVISIVKNNALQ